MGQQAEQQRHGRRRRYGAVGGVRFETFEYGVERRLRRIAEIAGDLLGEVLKRAEHAKLGQHYLQVQRIVRPGRTDQRFYVPIVKFLEVPSQVFADQ